MEDHPKYQAGPEPEAEPELDHWPTTDELIAMARAHRQGEAYPTPERLIENLPVVLRGLCDYVLSGKADTFHTAYSIASIVEVIERVKAQLTKPNPSQH